jgi:hypothetical protein
VTRFTGGAARILNSRGSMYKNEHNVMVVAGNRRARSLRLPRATTDNAAGRTLTAKPESLPSCSKTLVPFAAIAKGEGSPGGGSH